MDWTIKNHILLRSYGIREVPVDLRSWQISYQEDKNYYLCRKLNNGAVIKMKSVENFMAIWAYENIEEINKCGDISKAKISLQIEGKFCSECEYTRGCKKKLWILPRDMEIF